MNKIINKYLITKFFKIFFITTLVFFSLGIILNLFEEVEFFKNLNLSFALPIVLSLSYVPTLIIELLPFIVFLSSMVYFLQLRSSKDLLSIKVFGYSNIRIILILSFFSFFMGLLFLFTINPITSILVKYYETEKAQYSKDVDHLISVNKNGVWIKEVDTSGYKIITAERLRNEKLEQISVYIFNKNKLIKRIESESGLINNNSWKMKNAIVFNILENKSYFFEEYLFESKNTAEKINSLYKNLNTISFLDLILNYAQLNEKGYSKKLLNETYQNDLAEQLNREGQEQVVAAASKDYKEGVAPFLEKRKPSFTFSTTDRSTKTQIVNRRSIQYKYTLRGSSPIAPPRCALRYIFQIPIELGYVLRIPLVQCPGNLKLGPLKL